MGWGKRLKRLVRTKLKILDPVGGKLLGDALLPKDKAGPAGPGALDQFGNPLQSTEYYQKQLGDEQTSYRGIHAKDVADTTADAQKAGSYSDTREGKASIEAEAGARDRGVQTASMARINALRRQLGLPESGVPE
jgi:hypothetical protein